MNLEVADQSFSELVQQDPERAMILLDDRLKHEVTTERESWIIKAQIIYYLKETELWQHHPEGFKNFFEYCAQPEIDISSSVVSDMLALCTYAPHLLEAGIDIWKVVIDAGPSKVRQIVPQIREAYRSNVLAEQITPIVDAIHGMSFREVLQLTSTSEVRTEYNYDASFEENDEGITVTLRGLDMSDVEYIAKKANLTRWYDKRGVRIDPPYTERLA